MINFTVFTSKNGKWWTMVSRHKSLSYSTLINELKFDKKRIKKMKLKLSKNGNKITYENITFKREKIYYKIINSGDQPYAV